LNLRTRETVHLAVLQEGRAISIEKFDSPHPVGLDARLGGVMPLHCTGVGKVLLAYQDEEARERMLPSLPLARMTARTMTTLTALRKQLEQVHRQGYAVDQEEAVEGLRCVAAPLINHLGQTVAAFSVAGPATRITSTRVPEIARLVLATSREISFRLGYRPPNATPLASGPSAITGTPATSTRHASRPKEAE